MLHFCEARWLNFVTLNVLYKYISSAYVYTVEHPVETLPGTDFQRDMEVQFVLVCGWVIVVDRCPAFSVELRAIVSTTPCT